MKRNLHEKFKTALTNNYECYILITCQKPSETGDMQVEMTYDGDATLASYLLQGAQTVIHEQEDCCSQVYLAD